MIQPKGVTDFLAHDHTSPFGLVVRRSIKVTVVDFDGTLRDMAATQPDLRDAKPAVEAVAVAAHLDPASRWPAAFGIVNPARPDSSVQSTGHGPIS